MIPAYANYNGNFFFFGIYIYFGNFTLVAILVAIIVDNYW